MREGAAGAARRPAEIEKSWLRPGVEAGTARFAARIYFISLIDFRADRPDTCRAKSSACPKCRNVIVLVSQYICPESSAILNLCGAVNDGTYTIYSVSTSS